MIEVELPDGTIAEFPDGTSNDVIKGALQKRFGAAQQEAPQTSDPRDSLLGKADAFMRGAADTLTFGTADEVAAALNSGSFFGANKGLWGDYDKELAAQRATDQSDAQDRFGYRLGGQVGGGLVGGTGLVKAGLSPTAAAIDAGWSLPGVALASGAEGAALGGLQGLGSGEGGSDRLDQAQSGALMGGLVGGAAPFVVAGVQKALSPFTSSSDRQVAAALLGDEGVPLSAGQKTGSKWLQYRESELGGNHAADLMDEQARAFTNAAMQKAGGSGLADPDNLAALKSSLGQGFEDISARNALRADPQLGQDIGKTLNRYDRLLEAQQKPIINNIADEIMDRLSVNNGVIPGPEYQTIRSDLSSAASSTSNETLAKAFRGLRNALDDAMDRSINPADAGQWATLRRQYGNYKVLQRAANGGGEAAGFGVISPARLRMAASSGNGEGFATGASDFTKLAKAGQAMMTPLPNSGTAQRVAAQGVAAALLGGGGMGVAGPWGLAAGLAGPALAGKALMSRPVQAYLSNQAASEITPEMRAIINALINSEGSAAAGRLAP